MIGGIGNLYSIHKGGFLVPYSHIQQPQPHLEVHDCPWLVIQLNPQLKKTNR